MRFLAIAPLLAAASLSGAQTVMSVYNRDTHEPFVLKSVKVESTVVGPIVRTSTLLTYDNPYTKLTEATLNFTLPDAGALSGFAYYYGDEYVPGQLMDKSKAWFIYTAITSRGRDPGIMEQWSPTQYHCQIYPIMGGRDLRIRLYTLDFLKPDGTKLALPKPEVPIAVGYEVKNGDHGKLDWSVRSVDAPSVTYEGDGYSVPRLGESVQAVAQRFSDGRTYVAGIFQTPDLPQGQTRDIKIIDARYEAANQPDAGADVTNQVQHIVDSGAGAVDAANTVFGDPAPNQIKRLKVSYSVDGVQQTASTPENGTMRFRGPDAVPTLEIPDLRDLKTVNVGSNAVAFMGWVPSNRELIAQAGGQKFEFRPQGIAQGSDLARLWAQQMLATGRFSGSREVLDFSLKYGVPSNATALLAVPSTEMKLFREKEVEWQKQEAERRRREREIARQSRGWGGRGGGGGQNWRAGGGGDPEIRVNLTGAQSADARFADGRVVPLTPTNGAGPAGGSGGGTPSSQWGGNFEIPASEPEGTYPVQVEAKMADGSVKKMQWTYQVDRTPPVGKATFAHEGGHTFIEVRSEPKLNEVAVFDEHGKKWTLKEVSPGVYRVQLPNSRHGKKLVVVMKDMAGNKGEITCSWPR